MRIAGLARCQQLRALMDAAAGIAIGVLPGMRLDVNLNPLDGRDLVRIDDALSRSGKPGSSAAAAAPDALIRFGAVLEQKPFDEHVARRVTWSGMDDQMLIAEVEVIAFLGRH